MKKQFITKSSDEFWDFFSKPDKNTEALCFSFGQRSSLLWTHGL